MKNIPATIYIFDCWNLDIPAERKGDDGQKRACLKSFESP